MKCYTLTETAMHAFMRRQRKGYGYDSLWYQMRATQLLLSRFLVPLPLDRPLCGPPRVRRARNRGLGEGAKCVMAGHGHWRQEVLPCCDQ